MSEDAPRVGRPSKWDPVFCEMLISHMAEGYSFKSFGGVIDVTEETLHQWKKEKPEFSESYRRGKLKSLLEWEKIGKEGLYEIVQKDKDGNINRLKMNARVWETNMRNRFNWDRKEDASEMQPIHIKFERVNANDKAS